MARLRWLLGGLILTTLALGLTGSMPGWFLGDSDWLDKAGRADPVTAWPSANAWSSYGGDPGGQRRADLPSLTPASVGSLQPAWVYRTGHLANRGDAAERASFQATPILAADQLVFCTPFNEVIALDPGTGSERWRFDAELPQGLSPANGFTCRGVSQWLDAKTEVGACWHRLFMGTADARVIAIDAATGERCASFGSQGEVRLTPTPETLWSGEYQITSAPAVVGDTVVVGSAISDNVRVRAPRGTVHAFDARTGAMRRRFDPVPRSADDPARASWAVPDSALPGHGNVWSTISADADRGLVFLPTSSLG